MNAPLFPPRPNRREAMLALVASALLPACGGGTDVAGLSSGGTGSYSTGVVVGLGSVIVNGVRYDDSSASIRFDDQPALASAIQLGMVVRIQGSTITPPSTPGGLSTATASRITCDVEWRGPIAAVDTTTNTFELLGQTVHVPSTAVFTGGSFGPALNSQYAEVYGFLNPSDGSLQASRVQVRSSRPDSYRLSGLVARLDAGTFRLGTAVINHASAAEKPANLKNGLLVQVELDTTPNAGAWVARRIRSQDYGSDLVNDARAEIEGSITAFTSPAAFEVNGISVDASQITPPGSLALGVRVEVKGTVRNGVVVASAIEVEDEHEVETREYEFHSTVSALDTNARTFVIRGYTVHWDDQTRFSLHGLSWANGIRVEVKARLDGSGQLLATNIEAGD